MSNRGNVINFPIESTSDTNNILLCECGNDSFYIEGSNEEELTLNCMQCDSYIYDIDVRFNNQHKGKNHE